MMTDPIADMLTRIRNASLVKKEKVSLPYSRLKFSLAQILKASGYLQDVFRGTEVNSPLVLTLKYQENRRSVITLIQRVSTPGRRVYVGKDEIPKILNDQGIAILSTSKGLLTNKEARAQGVGGEIICKLY